MRTQTTLLGALIVLVLTAAASANAPKHAASTKTGAAPSSGLVMRYQTHDRTGTALVLLRGALGTIGSCVGNLLLELAGTRQVIATEQAQRCGRSACHLTSPWRIRRPDEIGYPGRTTWPQQATSSRRNRTRSSRAWSAT